MGNVIQGINQDGSNSGTFMGNYHNIGSTTTNFTGANVNFTGTNQRIVIGSTGSTGTITYWNSPSFMTGASFPDGTRVTFGLNNNAFLDSTGKINSSFIPTTTTSSTVNTITVNQSLSGTGSINLSSGSITGATGYFQNLNSNNAAADLYLFPSHTGNILLGNDASGNYIYLKNNIYASSSSKGINGGFFNGYSSNTDVSLGGNTNQGNVNVGKDITSGNVNLGNSAASGTGTINLYQNVTAAKNLTLSNTNGIISAPTHTGSNYYVGTSLTGPGAINTTGNITTSGTISGASFTGSNYYLGTSMTGPGSINTTGSITGANFYGNVILNSNSLSGNGSITINPTLVRDFLGVNINYTQGGLIKAAGGGIEAQGTNTTTYPLLSQNALKISDIARTEFVTMNIKSNGGLEIKHSNGNIANIDSNMSYVTTTGGFNGTTGNFSGAVTAGGDFTANSTITSTGLITASGGITASSSKPSATSAPVGGLRVRGTNQWIIGENSGGQLCFYQGNSSTTPLACITTAGNLVAGTG